MYQLKLTYGKQPTNEESKEPYKPKLRADPLAALSLMFTVTSDPASSSIEYVIRVQVIEAQTDSLNDSGRRVLLGFGPFTQYLLLYFHVRTDYRLQGMHFW
ncbi:unnamed protein product [Absidia cylindrospora]